MGLYSRFILPQLIDWSLGGEVFAAQRRTALATASGRVLEIGFGGGLNLPHYPTGVETVVGVEPIGSRRRVVAARVAAARFPVELVIGQGEHLPFDAGSFDCVVSTWTLCSVRDPAAVFAELKRVLRPGGRFLFQEHGRSADPRVARQQDRWTWLTRLIGGNCHLNRPIAELIGAGGWQIEALEQYVLPGMPRLGAEQYRGRAVVGKAES